MEGPYQDLDWETFKVGDRVTCRKERIEGRLELREGDRYIIRQIQTRISSHGEDFLDNSARATIIYLEDNPIGYFIWRFRRIPKVIDEGEDE